MRRGLVALLRLPRLGSVRRGCGEGRRAAARVGLRIDHLQGALGAAVGGELARELCGRADRAVEGLGCAGVEPAPLDPGAGEADLRGLAAALAEQGKVAQRELGDLPAALGDLEQE